MPTVSKTWHICKLCEQAGGKRSNRWFDNECSAFQHLESEVPHGLVRRVIMADKNRYIRIEVTEEDVVTDVEQVEDDPPPPKRRKGDDGNDGFDFHNVPTNALLQELANRCTR